MMLYEYKCDPCARIGVVERSIAQRDDPVACSACGCIGRRIISKPTLNLNGWAYQGTVVGVSAEDRLAAMRREEKSFEAQLEKEARLLPGPGRDIADCYMEAKGELSQGGVWNAHA